MLEYQRGDESAFRELYRRYRGPLHRFIHRLTGDPAVAEEIFQETWMAVVHAKERYATNAKFITYLFGIAQRRASDYWRKRHRQSQVVVDEGHQAREDVLAVEASPDSSPHICAEKAGFGDALLAALDRLPAPQREAFLLRAEGDFTLDEIGEITGVSRETIKSRLRYAVERLRAAMKGWQ